MPTQLEQIRDQQQAAWDKFSAGWKKWDSLVMGWLAPVGTAILDGAGLRADSSVLDIASGTGEPAISAAKRCPAGKVVMTDLSEKMLEVAKENAARQGIHNLEARQCDAGALPFADASFDAVTARFGFMFFPDISLAAREFARVARPGGRVCASVWGAPAKNSWAATVLGVIAKHVPAPPPPPGTPGLFRCAAPGYMEGIFREAGLKNIAESEVSGPQPFENAATYFAFMSEVVAPVAAALAKVDDAARAKIRSEVIALVDPTGSGGSVRVDWSAQVIRGDR